MIQQLRKEILAMEGYKGGKMQMSGLDFGLGEMMSAFPLETFPIGVVHEFISPTAACATATNGFISGLLSTLMKDNSYCLWISTKRSLFPAALAFFALKPHQIIFVDVHRDKEALWVMEQGLRCEALTAVVAELGEVGFVESQRLQLAVEQSRVTGFLHRRRPRRQHSLACATRWRIKPMASHLTEADPLPGLGHPAWEVHLDKIRNGQPGKWQLSWRRKRFECMPRRYAPTRTELIREHYA